MTRIFLLFFPLLFELTLALELEVINQWNLLPYELPFDIDSKDIRPENIVFTGLEITEDRYFLAMPRLRAGVPATLATIPKDTPRGSSPILKPYPDWSWHAPMRGANNCSGIISVYRMRKDSCNRLWVLDSGVMSSLDDFTRVCQPKLLVFDLKTDQLVRSITFPNQVLRPASLLTNLIIDESIQGTCDSSFVYMSDTAAPGLVVYDGLRDTAWRIMAPAMFPDPDLSTYDILGEKFTLMDGVVGLAHSAKLATLFFQPLATDRIFSISTSFLTKGPPGEFEEVPISLAGRKSSQGLGLALNNLDETLYFSPLTETSVASWNPLTNRQSLMAFDPQLLQFPSELRWHEDGNVYLLSTRFQKFFLRRVSPNEINLRILRIRPRTSFLRRPLSSNHIYF